MKVLLCVGLVLVEEGKDGQTAQIKDDVDADRPVGWVMLASLIAVA